MIRNINKRRYNYINASLVLKFKKKHNKTEKKTLKILLTT